MDWGKCSPTQGIPDISCIPPLIGWVTRVALGFIGTVSLFLLIAAGIKYITSGGGKGVEEAKNMITYAIIGLIVVLLSFFIVDLIGYFTGATCILNFGFSGC